MTLWTEASQARTISSGPRQTTRPRLIQQSPSLTTNPLITASGVRPSLALDSAGNPRVGYDAELWWGGSNPYIQCNIAVPVARFGLFNK